MSLNSNTIFPPSSGASQQMKLICCVRPGQLEMQMRPKPALEKDRALLRIRRIGICGTDLHAYQGNQPYFDYPRVLGHELAAEVEMIGEGTEFRTGDKVTILPYFHCGQCIACRTGKPNCCVHMKVCGVHIDGGMAEYLSAPVSSLIKCNELDWDELALTEPFAIATHGINRAQVQPNEWVLVMGAGPIGLATMEMAAIKGARIVALDMNEFRLEMASHIKGVELAINPGNSNPEEVLRTITAGDMATVVIDATGNLPSINHGLKFLAHGGRYVLIGLQKQEFSFSHPEFHKRETTLMSSRNATKDEFEYVLTCIREKLITPSKYITHRCSLEEMENRFNEWLLPGSGIIKAVVELA